MKERTHVYLITKKGVPKFMAHFNNFKLTVYCVASILEKMDMETLEKQGFTVSEETHDEDRRIHLVLRRMSN